MEVIRRWVARSSVVTICVVVLNVGALICTRYLDFHTSSLQLMDENSPHIAILSSQTVLKNHSKNTQNIPKIIDIPLNCSIGNMSKTCPVDYYPSKPLADDHRIPSTSPPTCPDYFRWIYDDLRPWSETGITQEMVMVARRTANFRLVILNGRAYVETYKKSFQSRDTFTLWGILQLLRRYPGKLPDLDLMFDCVDWPVIRKDHFTKIKTTPPPLFRYCGDDSTLDIVFPDWSFWGWPEINIKPWKTLSKELKKGNKRTKWTEREPYAYWKGNPAVAQTRMDLMKCNVSDQHDWNARVYAQDWLKEQKEGYKDSDLSNQCKHRYKIYIEGSAWSVSEKYILACDSVTLLVKPLYYDFFTRGLIPLKHYWPIKDNDKCRSIKHAVHWGNSHHEEVRAIGKAASDYIQKEVTIDLVYDYMFHLLSEYAKLLTYKPSVPPRAVELCSESMACESRGVEKKFMMESLVKGPSWTDACSMPPPLHPASFHAVIETINNGMKKVEEWEKEYWQAHSRGDNKI